MASTNAAARGVALPSLSRTFQTDQMLTPRYLERITIDNPHYRGYVTHSTQTQPHHLSAVQRRVQKYGDSHFFVHRDIPLHQSYCRTTLALSDVRPWDDIVSRPLQSQRVIQKESHLPFPAEHPYTSHISRFAVFPDTKSNLPCIQQAVQQSASPGLRPDTVSVCTQTPLNHGSQHTATSLSTMAPKPATPYYVFQKVGERGHRVESRSLTQPVPVETRSGSQGCGLLWDMPRSRRHQRAHTYPAPSLQFGPVTPSTALAVSPQTQEALASTHKTLTRTTAYSEHFPRHSTGVQNILRLEENTRGSQRPHTTESRGKYGGSRGRPGFASGEVADDQHHLSHSSTGILSESHNQEFDFETESDSYPVGDQEARAGDESGLDTAVDGAEAKRESNSDSTRAGGKPHLTVAQSGTELNRPQQDTSKDNRDPTASLEHTKVDKGTQTDPEDFTQPIQFPVYRQQSLLPEITNVGPLAHTSHNCKPSAGTARPATENLRYKLKLDFESESQLPGTSCMQPQYLPSRAQRRRPHSADDVYSYTPRTASSTRRMMSAYGYSKSDALRRFHQQYRETTPDLREYSICEGKRHIIHGSHAYFFH